MVNPEVYPLNPPHVFEIVTSTMTFYVGVDMTGALPHDLVQKPEGIYIYVHVHVYVRGYGICGPSLVPRLPLFWPLKFP